MAKGQTIDELYIGLGLNLQDLQSGFVSAEQTMSQAMAKLNAENKKIKLKADTEELKAFGDLAAQAKAKHTALTEQLKVQTDKLKLLEAAWKNVQKDANATDAGRNKAETAYLGQAKAVAKLNAELRKMQPISQQATVKSASMMSKLTDNTQKAQAGMKGVVAGISSINAKYAAFIGTVAGAGGLFALTEGAVKSGEAIYRLQARLHATTAEAGKLSKVFTFSDVDINMLPAFLVRLDKTISGTGKSAEEASEKLARYGINLRNEDGTLKGTTAQLTELSKAYMQAVANGEEEAFSMDVLGAKGQALIPVLDQFTEKLEIAGSIKSTGFLDAKAAHEANLEYMKMTMQLNGLKGVIGQSLLPVTKEVMPMLTTGAAEFADVIKSNKDEIKDAISGWASVGKGLAETFGEIALKAGSIAKAVKDNQLSKMADGNIKEHDYDEAVLRANAKGTALDVMGAVGGGVGAWFGKVAGLKGAAFGAYVGSKLVKGADVTLNRVWDNLTGAWDDKVAVYEQKKKEQQANKGTKETQKQEEAKPPIDENALKKAAESTKELDSAMFELTHSDLENQLRAIDEEAGKFLSASLPKDRIEEYVNAKKEKLTAEWDEQVASQIDSIWKTEYENRLDAIEREKKAWVQKGLDEVKATKWAEQQKTQLKQQTVKDMFTSQKKYLDIYRKAIASGMGQEGAAQEIARQMRKDNGISDMEFTTESEIMGFQNAMKSAQENLVPILSESTYQGVKQAMIEVFRGTEGKQENPSLRMNDLRDVTQAGHSFRNEVTQAGQAFASSLKESYQIFRGTEGAAESYGGVDVSKHKLWTMDEMRDMIQRNEKSSDMIKLSNGSIALTPQKSLEPIDMTGGRGAEKATVNYNLHVEVSGLDDVANEVAQTAAKKIIDSVPALSDSNLSYA